MSARVISQEERTRWRKYAMQDMANQNVYLRISADRILHLLQALEIAEDVPRRILRQMDDIVAWYPKAPVMTVAYLLHNSIGDVPLVA